MFIIVPPLLSILIGILLWFITQRWTPVSSKNHKKLPPGPRGLPIIGNLHMLGNIPHRALNDLSKKYGPIMFLKLGSVPMVVISSPSAAELILKTHDNVFSNRPRLDAVEHVTNSSKGMLFSPPYSPEWRKTKKFSIQELLNTSKIESFAGVRREEVGALLASIKKAAAGGEVVDLSEMVGELMENITYKMLFGFSNDNKYGLKRIVHEINALMGAFNIAEYVPFLKPFDLQGLYKRMKAAGKAMDNVVGEIINKHEEDARNGTQKTNKDFVDMMLSSKTFSSADKLDQENIKSLLFEVIVGAIDTSYTWIEWTLAELLRNPRAMRCLQEELKANVGLKRMVEEKDLPNLQYLEMVIKETFRLHPPAPLLIPRESMEDIEINGYYIPKKSRVIVNAWAIGRDPSIWSNNVNEFIPERFVDKDIIILGHDFVLLPFGYGKRMCPGAKLGLLNVKLIVSHLVHCFDWELPKGTSPSELDMAEAFGLITAKSKHLIAIPSYRLLC